MKAKTKHKAGAIATATAGSAGATEPNHGGCQCATSSRGSRRSNALEV